MRPRMMREQRATKRGETSCRCIARQGYTPAMSDPPLPPLPPQRPPAPPPLVPNYQEPQRTRSLVPAMAFFLAFVSFFPLTIGLFFVIPGDRALWLSPIFAFILIGAVAGWRRSSMGFLGVLVALVLGLLGCGVCASLLKGL